VGEVKIRRCDIHFS